MALSDAGRQNLDSYVRAVRPAVQRFVEKRVRIRDHADEIVSRVFEAIARNWESFRGDKPTEAFAMFVASNALKNYYSRDLQKLSRQISLDDWVETYSLQHDPGLACPYERIESADWVGELMKEMGRCCSKVETGVISMYYEGQSLDEIATLTGMNSSTVRGHFLRGRKKLLAHLLTQAPHLLGGLDRLSATVHRVEMEQPGLLSEEELTALRTQAGPTEVVRKAILKVAPFLEGLF